MKTLEWVAKYYGLLNYLLQFEVYYVVFQLSAVISYFADRNQRILVLGREHMRNWRSAKYKGVAWFYTSNM
jgi:hypothetical protein